MLGQKIIFNVDLGKIFTIPKIKREKIARLVFFELLTPILRGSQLTPHIFSASNFKQLPFQHNAWYDPENLGHEKALTASQATVRRIMIKLPHRRTSVAQTPRVFGTIFSATGHLEVL